MLIPFISADGKTDKYIKSVIEEAITILLEKGVQISSSGSEGGYLSIFHSWSEFILKPIECIACGKFPTEKRAPYFYFSNEKGVRLNKNYWSSLMHVTSRQSANNEIEEYGGAVFICKEAVGSQGMIFSFSGLKAYWDEFLSVLASCFWGHSLTSFNLNNVVQTFKNRFDLIAAADSDRNTMLEVVETIVARKLAA